MIKRFYLLDIARGLAALSIVIWHFNHFYYLKGVKLPEYFLKSQQPFYNLLWIFYDFGINAVLFFFSLSGFIFFWLYLNSIKKNKINYKEFFILRFSRLYPLHFVTLIFVAVFQFIFFNINGNFIIYEFNNFKHFILNLFLISHWGFQQGWSFNAPIWTVSLEVFAYGIFFLFAKMKMGKLWHIIIILLLTYPITKISVDFGIVIFFFFIGGGSFLIYEFINTKYKFLVKNYYFVLTLFLTITLITYLFKTYSLSNYDSIKIIYMGMLFSIIILFLAFLQNIYIKLGRKISVIGDLTYSTYLLHFPLQLIIIGFIQHFDYNLFLGKTFFIIFFIVLLLLSHITYKYFELPSQKYIRQKFNNKHYNNL